MSEYKCSQGHLMLPSEGSRCRLCGGKVATEDGMTDPEIEREEEKEENENDDE